MYHLDCVCFEDAFSIMNLYTYNKTRNTPFGRKTHLNISIECARFVNFVCVCTVFIKRISDMAYFFNEGRSDKSVPMVLPVESILSVLVPKRKRMEI